MLYNVNQRSTTGQKEKPMDEDKQRVAEGTPYQHDYSPDTFYGRTQNDELGMER